MHDIPASVADIEESLDNLAMQEKTKHGSENFPHELRLQYYVSQVHCAAQHVLQVGGTHQDLPTEVLRKYQQYESKYALPKIEVPVPAAASEHPMEPPSGSVA